MHMYVYECIHVYVLLLIIMKLISGQEQHMGTRAPPRELLLENSMMPPPPDPGVIRVQVMC